MSSRRLRATPESAGAREALAAQMPAAQNAVKAVTEVLAAQRPAALTVQMPADLMHDRASAPEDLAAQHTVHVGQDRALELEALEARPPEAVTELRAAQMPVAPAVLVTPLASNALAE